MGANSDWTLSWHSVISTCQQGAQAERQKHSGRKAGLEEEGGSNFKHCSQYLI